MAKKSKAKQGQVVGFVGVGLDSTDGEKRVTTSDNFVLLGGSQETHESMQDTAIKFEEALRHRRKRLQETPLDEVIELFHEAQR